MSRRSRQRALVRELKHADAYTNPDCDDETDHEGADPDVWAHEWPEQAQQNQQPERRHGVSQ